MVVQAGNAVARWCTGITQQKPECTWQHDGAPGKEVWVCVWGQPGVQVQAERDCN